MTAESGYRGQDRKNYKFGPLGWAYLKGPGRKPRGIAKQARAGKLAAGFFVRAASANHDASISPKSANYVRRASLASAARNPLRLEHG